MFTGTVKGLKALCSQICANVWFYISLQQRSKCSALYYKCTIRSTFKALFTMIEIYYVEKSAFVID